MNTTSLRISYHVSINIIIVTIVYARKVMSPMKISVPYASQDTIQIMKERIIALLAVLEHIYKDLALLIQVIVRNVKLARIPWKEIQTVQHVYLSIIILRNIHQRLHTALFAFLKRMKKELESNNALPAENHIIPWME